MVYPETKHLHPDKEVLAFPASFSQHGMWFLEQLESGSAAFNIITAYRLTGDLQITVLAEALAGIVERHESLRTTIAGVGGNPMQIIAPPFKPDLPAISLGHLTEATWQAEAMKQAGFEAARPFDLEKGPLFRGKVFQFDDTRAIFVFVIHHIISDGWSVNILFNELFTLYNALLQGQPSPLPELPLQYADFSVWQQEWLVGDVLKAELDYWKNQLKDAPNATEFPTDYPRPPVQSYRGEIYRFTISNELTQPLAQFCRREGATLYMALLASFQVLLYRYTGQTDLVIGSPLANRTRPEVENIIGLFVNMLLFRTRLSGSATFREILQKVRQTALEAYDHQDLPFDKVVEVLQPPRDLSRHPLYQIMLALQNMPDKITTVSGLTLEPIDLDASASEFDLQLFITADGDSLKVVVSYSTDLFVLPTIEQIMAHWLVLLEAVVTAPDTAITHLPLLTPAEHRQLLGEWNETTVSVTAEWCIHALVEAQVERSPEAIAVMMAQDNGKTTQLTYRELNHRANQLARVLQKQGLKPDMPVGICLERSTEMIVGLLAILKAGGAYLPLDPAYPPERLTFILTDAAVSLIVTRSALADLLPATGAKVICLDANWAEIAQESSANLPATSQANHLAYIIYTSGSTGKPKGVMIEHHSLSNFIQTAQLHYHITPADRVLQFASINFDAAIEEIFTSLVGGATLVLRPDSMLTSLAVFLQKCRAWQLTVLDLPTAFWHELITTLQNENLSLPPALRLVIIGGEEAQQQKLEIWEQYVTGQVQLFNTYGPTEATVVATIDRLSPHNQALPGQKVPIGRPLGNLLAYVLDAHLQPVPIGIPGELHIGGAGVARGYLNRPELTAEKFIPNPFGHGRLYKTGDLARYRLDGRLEFWGRIDRQVKLRGFRVELGEIETALRTHPAVREAVVVAREDRPGDKRLVAYLLPADIAPIVSADLRVFLQQSLPDYMIPTAFVALPEFPKTASGKIDPKALPAPDLADLPLANTHVSPATPTEIDLAAIWEQTLNLLQVGVTDNFFDLGGHSLLATQVMAQIAHKFHIDLPVRVLFQKPTIAELAQYLDRLHRTMKKVFSSPLHLTLNREEFDL